VNHDLDSPLPITKAVLVKKGGAIGARQLSNETTDSNNVSTH
jgi:hypothetical protein